MFGLLVILLLAAQFASAKTVDEVIEKYIKARGGRSRLAGVKSIYMEAVKDSSAGQAQIKFIKEQDKLSRTEIEAGEETGIVLVTDQNAWSFFPFRNSSPEKISNLDLTGLQTEMDIAGPLVDYESKGHSAELLGKEVLEGFSCYKIKLVTNTGKEMMFWLDAGTCLITQSSVTAAPGIKATTFTLYKNYQPVDGIQFPYSVETKTYQSANINNVSEMVFSKIILNPPIDPKMYQLE